MASLAVKMPENPRPQFRVAERQPVLPEDLVEDIVRMATWNARFALYDTMTPGRSLYTFRASQQGEVDSPMKLKGAGGLTSLDVDGKRISLLVPPEPRRQYSPARQLHFVLGQDYTLGAVLGSVKSMYSCSADACRNEYALQRKANEHRIAMPPLLHGTFEGETDLLGRQTGAIAVAANPEYQTVGRMNAFKIMERNGKPYAHTVLGADVIAVPLDVMSTLRATTVRMMGEVKRTLLVQAGIARHAGHEGNFLINPERTHVIASDFDSATELSALDADVRAFQVLRDVAHDAWRVLYKFASGFGVRDEALAALAHKDANPVRAFLLGFFGKTVSAERIEAEAERLTQRFLRFVRDRKSEIEKPVTDAPPGSEAIVQSLSAKKLYPLFTDCIVACVALLQADDDVRNRGYVLPDISEPDLRAKADRGLEIFDRMVDEESDRAHALMKAEGKQIADYF